MLIASNCYIEPPLVIYFLQKSLMTLKKVSLASQMQRSLGPLRFKKK